MVVLHLILVLVINYIIQKYIDYKLPSDCKGMYFQDCDNFPYSKILNYINQKYGMYNCFKLTENNNYDIVFRIRYDNYYLEPFNINETHFC